MTISILIGSVRIATADDWTQAREMLRKDIERSYEVGLLDRHALAQEHYNCELANLGNGPDREGWLVTSGQWASGDTLRHAREGAHGLADGNLAIVHEYSNGNREGWTIDVKCKILHVYAESHKASVKITGDSSQFNRYDVVTIPCSFVITRGDAKQRAKRY